MLDSGLLLSGTLGEPFDSMPVTYVNIWFAVIIPLDYII